MKMSIARALKERKRLIGEMNTIRNRINNNNVVQINIKINDDNTYSTPEPNEIAAHRSFDPTILVEELYALRDKLIDLKAKIQLANSDIAKSLILLSELKAELIDVENMNRYRSGIEYVNERFARMTNVVFDESYIINKADELRKKINALQDEIDEYNATHFIEIAD